MIKKGIATIKLIESSVNAVSKVGKPYSYTVLHYVNGKGESKETRIMDSKMREKVTNQYHTGDTIMLHWGTNDAGYPTLVDVSRPEDSESSVTTQQTTAPAEAKTTNYSNGNNNVGMQVGNALTNATTLMASGQASGTLEEVAAMVIATGERLKKRMADGEFNV